MKYIPEVEYHFALLETQNMTPREVLSMAEKIKKCYVVLNPSKFDYRCAGFVWDSYFLHGS